MIVRVFWVWNELLLLGIFWYLLSFNCLDFVVLNLSVGNNQVLDLRNLLVGLFWLNLEECTLFQGCWDLVINWDFLNAQSLWEAFIFNKMIGINSNDHLEHRVVSKNFLKGGYHFFSLFDVLLTGFEMSWHQKISLVTEHGSWIIVEIQFFLVLIL